MAIWPPAPSTDLKGMQQIKKTDVRHFEKTDGGANRMKAYFRTICDRGVLPRCESEQTAGLSQEEPPSIPSVCGQSAQLSCVSLSDKNIQLHSRMLRGWGEVVFFVWDEDATAVRVRVCSRGDIHSHSYEKLINWILQFVEVDYLSLMQSCGEVPLWELTCSPERLFIDSFYLRGARKGIFSHYLLSFEAILPILSFVSIVLSM